MTEFHIRLQQAMNMRKINQTELCEKTGIPKSAMSQYISGAFKPKQRRTYLLSQALEVNEAWLMGYDVPAEKLNESSHEISDSSTIDDAISPSNFNPLEYRSSSDVVRYLRESKHMTRAEFASVLHCTEKTIKNIEEGHKLVSINLAQKISNCFGLPMPNTLFSATLYDRYQKLNKRDSAIVDTLLEPLDPDEKEYVTIQTAARGGDEPGEKKISKSEAEKLLSATPQNDKYD